VQKQPSRRFIFKNQDPEMELYLLRTTVARNPWQKGKKTTIWNLITSNVQCRLNELFDGTYHLGKDTCKKHIDILLDEYVSLEAASAKASGVEETYTEKRKLQEELFTLRRDTIACGIAGVEEKRKKINAQLEDDTALRNAALNGMSVQSPMNSEGFSSDQGSSSSTKKRGRSSISGFADAMEGRNELKRRQLLFDQERAESERTLKLRELEMKKEANERAHALAEQRMLMEQERQKQQSQKDILMMQILSTLLKKGEEKN
jgi:hypothetical protein